MNFKTWIESERGRALALSKSIGVPPSFVSKMVNGEKAIPAEHCKAIEAFSDGVVTCQEMRPTDWHKYWPELAQTTPQDASQTAKAA
jgi:DNA-binding transcriptional regulator YdaS (Cro superfamily)